MSGSTNTATDKEQSVIANLADEIDRCEGCAALQRLIDRAFAMFNSKRDSLLARMAWLKPLADLIMNPGAVLTQLANWIGTYIKCVLKPMYQPYFKCYDRLKRLAQDWQKLMAAIQRAQSRLRCNSLTIPSFDAQIPTDVPPNPQAPAAGS